MSALKDRVPPGVRPYLADAGVALLVLAVLYAPFLIHRRGDPGPFSPWAWVFTATTALPLVLRRRFPILCLLIIYGSLVGYNMVNDAPSEPIAWGMLVALYSLAWVGRQWHRIFAIVLITVTSLATMKSPTTAMIGLLTGSGALVLGTIAQRREQRLQNLAYRAGQLERAREAEAARAVATERARIARDMHDVLAHAVSLMIVQAEAGPVAVRTMPDRAEKAFDAIASAGRDAMTQLRRTLGILKEEQDTGVRAPQPTVAAIPALVAQVGETGLAGSYSVSGDPGRLTADAEVAAFRIVQEALTNTLKHAAATKVTVSLDWGDSLVITVRDDGTGAGTLGGSGNGLIGIRERAAACGGAASAHGDADGFTVTATLPVVAP
ncbi:histidine kinase [Actinoallomurus purpureus]|uniref:sensor histidine kinase n=1 Tax=Actinoallomurus purpureus TaxID=478114 RepID=UPI00209337FE|nr:histidine kinase [Actinoallomurus purpureus]MCO6005540.1 histidine kinase [Actinoallomurus purpureus]